MSSKPFNVEQAAHHSKGASVIIFKRLDKKSQKELNATVTLPVHLRYHQAGETDFTTVTIANPQVLIRCEDETGEY